MAIRECDCKEFQDSGHTDECNKHYGKAAPMKPDKEPDMRESCPCCAYDKSREVNGMEKCYSCGCQWYTGTIKRHCHPVYKLATIQGDIAIEALTAIATGEGRGQNGKLRHYSSYDSLQSVAKEALTRLMAYGGGL